MKYLKRFDESKDERDQFKLLKDITVPGKSEPKLVKRGKKYDSFGGLVSGITIIGEDGKETKINFDNTEYFKLV